MGLVCGRHKIEKLVYQEFEKMLIDKLNFSANRKYEPNKYY
ncbi:MAG: hypothetical protein ACTTJH_01270 [Bacteroidales bacterium]